MRIALYHHLPSGGAKRHTLAHARELARRGHELVEICPGTAEIDVCSLAPFVAERRVVPLTLAPPVGRIPGVTPYLHLIQSLALLARLDGVQRRMAAEIDRDGFDVALVKDCRLAMNPHLLRYLATPAVFFCHHGFDHWGAEATTTTPRERLARRWYAPARRLGKAAWRRAEVRNARAATLLLAASRFAAGEIRRHYGRAAEVIGAGVDADVFAAAPKDEGDYVLSVGELTPRKQYRFLVDALARIAAARRPPLMIAANFVDAIEAASVRAQAAELGVTLRIETITDDRALADAYRGARVFVFAARAEMLGLACLEAMSCGTPVVAVGEGGVAEMVVDGVTGWLTERRPDVFSDRLAALLADPGRRREMGAAAAGHVRDAWTWTAAGDRLARALSRGVTHRS